MPRILRALISVSDKNNFADFARGLSELGIEIVSTGGTASFLASHNIPVINVSDVTGFSEMLDGRVKTLHPSIHGGLLAVRSNPEHMQTLAQHAISPIDLVVVNLYPFVATIQKPDVSREEAIENIDIGGPAMIRSAAKNHVSVGVVTDPADYSIVLEELHSYDQSLQPNTLKALAAKAYRHTSDYDRQIADYLITHP